MVIETLTLKIAGVAFQCLSSSSPGMELLLQSSKYYAENVKKKKPLPLNQVMEQTKRTDPESRFPAKVQGNVVVVAEPLELHFGGFEVGKDYKKVVKLINVSPKLLDIRVLPTQTKHFQTEYTQTNRLLPGLSLIITVHFCPDDWRYFFDSIRVQCKGEENLLVPVHAYPVIDDLHIPTHISLPAVPLGNSSTYEIPLSCSCPVDFEFEVHCLQHHEAFSVQPLSGVIPARGETTVAVTFTPRQYGTAEITLELVISQFNSKPLICTLTASCPPCGALNQQDKHGLSAEGFSKSPHTKRPHLLSSSPKRNVKVAPSKEKQSKTKVKSEPYPDICTPAGLAKMLIQQQDKMSFKNLKEAMSRSTTALQTREVKDAVYQTQVRIQAQMEKDSHLRWQVHPGDDLFSTEEREQVLREQELAASEYMMQKVLSEKEVDFAQTFTKLSSHRVLRRAGQQPNCSPVLKAYVHSQLKVRQRALSLFQKAVWKVIFQIRMKSRLLLLRELISSSRNQNRERSDSSLDEKQWSLNLSLEKLLASELPSFACANLKDELAISSFGQVQVKPIKADFKPSVPFFSLRVPQHYKIMGYQEVPVLGAKALFDNSISCRALRTGAEDELIPAVTRPSHDSHEEVLQNEQEPEQDFDRLLLFGGFENPPRAHPSRIFVPAPSVYAFQPTPLYLETDFMFNFCPLPRQKGASKVPRDFDDGVHTSSAQNICHGKEDIIKEGISIWKMFPHQASTTLPRLGDALSALILPTEAPAALQDLPESMAEDIAVEANEANGVSLSPEMLQAAFALFEESLPKESTEQKAKDDEETPQQPLETPLQPQPNRYGRKVLARLKYINQLGKRVSKASSPASHRSGRGTGSSGKAEGQQNKPPATRL